MTGRGEAMWRPAEETGGKAGELDFGETLTLGENINAFRGYHYRFAGGRMQIDHADGSPFVSVDLNSGWARVEHLCGRDLYRGRFRFDSKGALWIAWEVRGPRKDYRMVTVYRKEA